jgi:DHA2 family methylenomycin A resistance protein-like MFS transporter
MTAGLAGAGVGYWLLAHVGSSAPYGALLPGLIVIPAGIGLAVPLMTSALLATVPQSRSGVASGVLNTVRQASGGIGVALFGSMMAASGVAGIHTALLLSASLMACGAVIAFAGIRQSPIAMTHEPVDTRVRA